MSARQSSRWGLPSHPPGVAAALLVLGYLALTIAAAIRGEEAHLTEKFGAAYPEYQAGPQRGADACAFSLAKSGGTASTAPWRAWSLALALLAWKAL